jgi:2'-hydroxyisoflavone reductase
VDDQKLLEAGLKPGNELPMWIPASLEAYRGFFAISSHKAVKDGLRFTPLAQTVTDTLEWVKTLKEAAPPGVGLDRGREKGLLLLCIIK